MEADRADAVGQTRLVHAIAETLAYADLFDYPLTAQQIHRYLVRLPISSAAVASTLATDPWLTALIEQHGDLFCFRGRGEIIALRAARQDYARALWRTGRALAQLVAHLPFVRMVAMIGSLTMDNARAADDDIDLFIVTAPGRVWLTRALVIVLVRLAALRGHDLCPNYLLSTERLAMPGDDIFTAHELAQMIPLYGRETFQALQAANSWLAEYLPNAAPRDEQLRDLGWLGRGAQRVAEFVLGGGVGNRLEQWIEARKLTQLRQQAAAMGSDEAELDSETCKGHLNAHGHNIRQHYTDRLAALYATATE